MLFFIGKLCDLLFNSIKLFHQTFVVGLTGVEPFIFFIHVVDNFDVSEALLVKLDVSYHIFMRAEIFLTQFHQHLLMTFVGSNIALETEYAVRETGK